MAVAGIPRVSGKSGKQPQMIAARPRTGRLQRQVRRCFLAVGATVRTADLADWCWPRQLLLGQPIRRSQRLHIARAARSVGAVRVARDGRQWLWQLKLK
jgi:hypothetical protein